MPLKSGVYLVGVFRGINTHASCNIDYTTVTIASIQFDRNAACCDGQQSIADPDRLDRDPLSSISSIFINIDRQ